MVYNSQQAHLHSTHVIQRKILLQNALHNWSLNTNFSTLHLLQQTVVILIIITILYFCNLFYCSFNFFSWHESIYISRRKITKKKNKMKANSPKSRKIYAGLPFYLFICDSFQTFFILLLFFNKAEGIQKSFVYPFL